MEHGCNLPGRLETDLVHRLGGHQDDGDGVARIEVHVAAPLIQIARTGELDLFDDALLEPWIPSVSASSVAKEELRWRTFDLAATQSLLEIGCGGAVLVEFAPHPAGCLCDFRLRDDARSRWRGGGDAGCCGLGFRGFNVVGTLRFRDLPGA